MGLITTLLTLPIAPVRGVAWVAEQIREEAERQWSDPASIRAELADVEELRLSGAIDEAEAEAREDELVQRLLLASPEQGVTLTDTNDDPYGDFDG